MVNLKNEREVQTTRRVSQNADLLRSHMVESRRAAAAVTAAARRRSVDMDRLQTTLYVRSFSTLSNQPLDYPSRPRSSTFLTGRVREEEEEEDE